MATFRHRHPMKRRRVGEAPRTTGVQATRCPPRAMHLAVCVDENLIVWGGLQRLADKDLYEGLASSDVWIYNASMDFWTYRICEGQHPPPTHGASSVLVRPYWYTIGGWSRQGFTEDVYRLHVTTQKWERVQTSSPGLSPRFYFTTWAHIDKDNKKIYCFGGYWSDMKSTGLHQYGDFVENKESSQKLFWNNQLLALDVKTNQWSNPLCKGIAPSPRAGHATAVLGDMVYICGGFCSDGFLIDITYLNLTTMTWSEELTTKGPVPERRCFHSLTAVGRDRLLLFGGLGPGYPLEDLWLLSTATMEWTLVKELTGHPRYYHTACCTQSSGKILIFGGGENVDKRRHLFSRCSDQILEIQSKPLESHPSKNKAILDISGELRDIAGALHNLPPLPSLHDIQLPEKWPDPSIHDPKRVDVTMAKDDTKDAMRQLFDMASSGKLHRTMYRMQQKTRGLFLLINNESFEEAREKGLDYDDREGTEVDAPALCELFTQLGFVVHCKDDCTAEDMRRELRAMLSRDHREYDCFACAILSHGKGGAILGTDGEPFSLYDTNSSSNEEMDSMTDILTKSGCTSLAGKPKLFFIQACQGVKKDTGVEQDDTAVKPSDDIDDNVTDEEKDSSEMPQGEERMDVAEKTLLALEGLMEGLEVANCRRSPAGADLFIAESTTAGFISYRNTLHGTWFVQALVYVFSNFAHMVDITELMTTVNNLVSMSKSKRCGFKQQSWIKSALNKKLYFFPGLYKPR